MTNHVYNTYAPQYTDDGDIEDNYYSDGSASPSYPELAHTNPDFRNGTPADYYSQSRTNHRHHHLERILTNLSETTATYVEPPRRDSHAARSHDRRLPPMPEKSQDDFQKPPNRFFGGLRKTKSHPQRDIYRHDSVEDLLYFQQKPHVEIEQPLNNEKRLFSFLFSKRVPPINSPDERTNFPWRKANLLKQIGFWWMWPMLVKGYKRTLQPNDLWTLPKNLTVEDMHQRFETHLNNILVKQEAKHLKHNATLDNFEWPNWALPWAMFLTFRLQYSLSIFYISLAFAVQTLSPLLSKQLILFVTYQYYGLYKTYNRGIGLTIGAVLMVSLNGFLMNHFFHDAMFTGAQAKAVLTKAILLKSFKLSAKSRFKFPAGRITSLMSTDLAKIDFALGFQPLLFAFPIPIIISIVVLLTSIGVSSLVGIGLFLVSLCICGALARVLYTFRQRAVRYTDERIGLMREVLQHIKIIKFYAWEMAYNLSISKIRNKEMRHIFSIKSLRNIITAYAVCLPTLTSMISFVTMWATDSMKAPPDVFSSLSLFTILAQCIMLLPFTLATGADALIGFARCSDYLSCEESDYSNNQAKHKANLLTSGFDQPQVSTRHKKNNVVIEVKHANFMWENFHEDVSELWNDNTYEGRKQGKMLKSLKGKHQEEIYIKQKLDDASIYGKEYDDYTSDDSMDSGSSEKKFPGLLDVNLSIKRNEFIMISGVIGSGKSSLLNALAGFMKLSNPDVGSMTINDEVLFCSDTWIQNTTVRENITFGKPFDLNLYRDVIFSCALEEDLINLPAGDSTEIGERGVTLSGGQKARIHLARACYSDTSILLLDDVLSAVDSRVGRHIIDHLFKGFLRNKTVVLATHQLAVLEAADRVVFLNGDGSVSVGTVDELVETNSTFRSLIEYNTESKNDDLSVNSDTEPKTDAGALARMLSDDNNKKEEGKTVLEEERAINAIGWSIYNKYLQLGSGKFGILAVPTFLFLVALATFFQLFTNTWLSFWTEHKYRNVTDKQYVAGYVSLSFLTVIFTALEFCMLTYIENNAAQLLNIGAVKRILHTPMSYMDTTPMGRILNRFTKDTDSLDNELGEQVQYFIFPMANIIGVIILCIIYLPWFAIAVPFLAFAFVFFANFYQGSSREIKRLEAIQRSKVFNNFNEILSGMQTIQACKANDAFMKRNDDCINKMNEAYYVTISSQRWLCVNLDILAACFALIICLLCITGQFNISPSSTGLLLSYIIQIVGLLSVTVRAMTATENEMNAVERLHHYAFELPQEAAYQKTEFTPPSDWPPSGYISFNNVSLRYRPNLPLIMENFNLNVYPGEKVGICGRTGAGKSSIMNALYRLTEVERGTISIDGLNIADMGLFDLRSRLSIIPQDPVLFQGTVRKNLDPFKEYTDDTLWDALRRSGLLDAVTVQRIRNTKYNPHKNVRYEDLHKFHLDQLVDDEGQNFSLGEKQLLALARALVRDSKILILDEATSSVDFETDSKIQDTISTEFRHCTTLCIAHRLKTILHYDRIFVMDKGKVVEKGVPWNLYQEGGLFKKMCDKARISPDDFF
jgi:ABC-type multidrug transport system fused ATPase/permease subunit